MNITINYPTLYGKVARSLSIIGKRSVDNKGVRLFNDITLSSKETEIITDYLKQAVIDISNETEAFISAAVADTSITLTFPTNHNSVLDAFIQQACDDYCVSYALYSWFTVTAPTIADKYLKDCQRQIGSIIRLIHNKKASTPSASSPFDINTTVTTNT